MRLRLGSDPVETDGSSTQRAESSSLRSELLIVLAIVVVGAIITWFRVPEFHQDRVWAEDSNIFLGEAFQSGPWAVIFQGYAGYQHFIPRMVIAAIYPFFDLTWYAVLIFVICSVLTGLAAAAVYWLARDLIPSRVPRVAVALITVLLPLATQETVGNLADLHTYAMWLTPWLLLYRPRTTATSVGWAIVTFATVMTEIQSAFFFFLIFFRLRRRDHRSWPVIGAFVVAAGAQVLTAVTGDRQTSNGALSIPSTVMGWLINSVMPLVTADPEMIRAIILRSGLLLAVVILVPIVIAALVVLRWGDLDQRVMTIALALGSAAIYTGSAWANSDVWFMYAEEGLQNIDRLVVNIRYGVASGMMLVAMVPLAAAVILRRWPGLRAKVIGIVACVAMLATLAVGSTMTLSLRDWVPRWSPAVTESVQACATLAPSARIELPVAPDRSVFYTCEEVLAHTPG